MKTKLSLDKDEYLAMLCATSNSITTGGICRTKMEYVIGIPLFKGAGSGNGYVACACWRHH
jgi:hypothetical protein